MVKTWLISSALWAGFLEIEIHHNFFSNPHFLDPKEIIRILGEIDHLLAYFWTIRERESYSAFSSIQLYISSIMFYIK